jgi:hypothetical protein
MIALSRWQEAQLSTRLVAHDCLQGDEGLIELAEGETLPVVDEAGNTLGTLHADGRVLDDAGQEIGMLDDEGNVVLFEQQAAEGEFECCYFVVTFMVPSGQAGVLDDAGQEIGMLDDEGNVVLFEQQAAEGEFVCCYIVVTSVLLSFNHGCY